MKIASVTLTSNKETLISDALRSVVEDIEPTGRPQ
jgi:hypothetical protein